MFYCKSTVKRPVNLQAELRLVLQNTRLRYSIIQILNKVTLLQGAKKRLLPYCGNDPTGDSGLVCCEI